PCKIAVGDCQFGPNVLFCDRIALEFSTLKMSTDPWTRARWTLTVLPNRTSTCVTRAPYIVPGAISCVDAVDVPSGRPRFCACAAVIVDVAVICGPGRFCSVALASSPHHGSG